MWKLSLGYAIPLGPVALVPGVTWMMHALNDLDEEEARQYPDQEVEARFWNLMVDVGIECGL